MEGGKKTNYVPLYCADTDAYNPFYLPEVPSAPSDAEAEWCSKATGINGVPVLATLSSLSFPDSFGHELIHPIPKNVVKNTGAACVLAGNTTPAAFGPRVPNLATQQHYYCRVVHAVDHPACPRAASEAEVL
jgi:hypothetical protein